MTDTSSTASGIPGSSDSGWFSSGWTDDGTDGSDVPPTITCIDCGGRCHLLTIVTEEQPLLPGFGKPQGYFRIDPPYLFAGQPRRWEATYDNDAAFPGLNSGFVALRKTKRAAAAYFDGHAETAGYDKLSDMRMWCDKADSATWGITQ